MNTGSSKSASCSRDAARPPPWRRWSSRSRYLAWKRPLGCGLSVYEGARVRQPAHERRASVTAGFAYARVSRVIALGRSHAVGAVGSDLRVGGRAPAPPQPTGGRQGPLQRCAAASGPRIRCLFASFSRYACLSCSLSLCLRQPCRSLKVRERAATGALVARRSRGTSGAAACAPARPPRRSRGRRGELSKSSLESVLL